MLKVAGSAADSFLKVLSKLLKYIYSWLWVWFYSFASFVLLLWLVRLYHHSVRHHFSFCSFLLIHKHPPWIGLEHVTSWRSDCHEQRINWEKTPRPFSLTLYIEECSRFDCDVQSVVNWTRIHSRIISQGCKSQCTPCCHSPTIFYPGNLWHRITSSSAVKCHLIRFIHRLVNCFNCETWWD